MAVVVLLTLATAGIGLVGYIAIQGFSSVRVLDMEKLLTVYRASAFPALDSRLLKPDVEENLAIDMICEKQCGSIFQRMEELMPSSRFKLRIAKEITQDTVVALLSVDSFLKPITSTILQSSFLKLEMGDELWMDRSATCLAVAVSNRYSIKKIVVATADQDLRSSLSCLVIEAVRASGVQRTSSFEQSISMAHGFHDMSDADFDEKMRNILILLGLHLYSGTKPGMTVDEFDHAVENKSVSELVGD